ncbi:enoyl-CoA hydratase/carnithine racemase [Novosphingobium sp. PhB165]|uniref:enoyl-CoA hydratase/isomerase family protein n=1 Tax=Novosphingobium sp. PhB165 TaxID=2485105 RepID=UPI0010D683B1|nr:enoyl-CoA hydratase/isomerase family protein [Novosphingobium sp. PhB165]TCM20609.1 enoyl-CoA hydratase/carnithine racemase [Novosphingobium sp. PhB165]
MSGASVLCAVVDGVHTITLNRPEKLNALTSEMFAALDEHLRHGIEGAACVHLKANGRSFCAGHDLDDLAATESYEVERSANDVIERLAGLPVPVVASVQGHCFTGGLELALAADIIIAAETAEFADTHSKWDLVPIWGLTQRLPRRVGSHKAMELMFTGRRCRGPEAEAIGLANRCVPDGELEQHASALCQSILANSARSNRAIKKLVLETDGMSLSQGLAWELHRTEGHGPDFQANLAARRA